MNFFSPSCLSLSLQSVITGSVWIAGAARAMGERRRGGEAKAAEMEILYLLKQVVFQPAHSSKVHHWIIKCGRLRICFSKQQLYFFGKAGEPKTWDCGKGEQLQCMEPSQNLDITPRRRCMVQSTSLCHCPSPTVGCLSPASACGEEGIILELAAGEADGIDQRNWSHVKTPPLKKRSGLTDW